MNAKMMPVMLVMTVLVFASFFYALQGISMQNQVPVLETEFHQGIDDYFSIVKTERDSAATGSALNQQLAELKKYPSKLLELKLVGVGKILTGIFILLFAILMALVVAMPMRLGTIIKKNQNS